MKQARKYAIALAVAVTGSVLCGNLPATAGGIELDKVDIVFSRNHDDAYGPGTPPPHQPSPPQAHMPPPHHGGPGGPGGHMPPPHRGWERRGFAEGPGGHMPPPHGHMPPPPHGEPRGHMPPPHGHMPPPKW